MASGIIPKHYLLDQSQPEGGRGILKEGGCGRESDSFHPWSLQSAPGLPLGPGCGQGGLGRQGTYYLRQETLRAEASKERDVSSMEFVSIIWLTESVEG